MRVVVDTNVWVSGLIRPDGPPGRVLEAVREGRLTAIASWAHAEEIAEVLRLPKLRRYRISEEDVAGVLLLLAPLLPTVEAATPLRDPDDAPVIAAAIAARAEAIVTGDADFLDDTDLLEWLRVREIAVYRPAEILKLLG